MPRGPQDLAVRKAWQKVSEISDAKVTEKCNDPLVMTNIAIENGHRNSGVFPLKMVIFQ